MKKIKPKPFAVDIAAALCLPPSFLELACRYCDKRQPLRKCSRCRDALYCSSECQRAHWKQGHKSLCSPMKVVDHKTYLDAHPKPIDQLNAIYETYPSDDGCGPYGIAHPLPVAERNTGVLPKWWNKQKRKVAKQHATNKND